MVDAAEVLARVPLSLEEDARSGEPKECAEEVHHDGAADVGHLKRRHVHCTHEGQ